jgi:hypothetical protein
MDLGLIIGLIGGIIGVISGLWVLVDRFKNRKPKIKAYSPYHWTGTDAVTGKHTLFVFFRFSNISQTPTYFYLDTLKAEILNTKLNKWEKVQSLILPTAEIQTDFTAEEKNIFGINKARFLDIFDDCLVKYSEPLCGYLCFHIGNGEYGKLKGEVTDSRLKKIFFEVNLSD